MEWFDALRNVTLLFGGGGSAYWNDTWEWTGLAWNQRSLSGPPARYLHAMAYDAAGGLATMFGGSDSNIDLADTWQYASAPVLTQQLVAPATCLGSSATMTAAAVGSTPLAYQWRRGNTNLADGGNRSGTSTPTLRISPVTPGDVAHDYNVVISNAAGMAMSGNFTLAVRGRMGDANDDGTLDLRDVQPFVEYMLGSGTSIPESCVLDINGDGFLDGLDIQAFANALTSE